MALIIGVLIPLIFIVLIEYFNDKIVDRKDIEHKTDVPILGAIGHNHKKTELPTFDNPKTSLAESFRSLRTNLQYFLKTGAKTIKYLQPLACCKTFCALNLAAINAMAGKKPFCWAWPAEAQNTPYI